MPSSASSVSSLSSATSTAVDLSRLPPPDMIEPLDYETLLAALLADLAVRLPEFTAFLESDPAIELLEIVAYRELLLRQRVNDAGRGLLLAYAGGADLDNLAALFGVTRNLLVPADTRTGAPAIMESDGDLRRRVVLAPDSYSVAGPASAYVFHALSASGDVLDASATSPAPGEVIVSVLSRLGDGAASTGLVAQIAALLEADDIRPLTDDVTVQSAIIVPVEIDAALTLYPGPDATLMLDTANAALTRLLDDNRRLGRDLTRSAIIAALHVGGVQNVTLDSPAQDIVIAPTQAANVSRRTVSIAGYGE